MQHILPSPPPPRGILTTKLSIILMTLTTMTIISSINNNNNDIVTTVFTPVAAEGGNLNNQYLPFAFPVDCCAYELSGTTEDSFQALPLILVNPSDTRNYGDTFFWPAGSRDVIPRKLNRDNNNTNSNTSTDIDDGGNSDSEHPKCSGSTFSIWYGYFDRYYPPIKGWTLNEWNPSPVKGEPLHIENNDIWATSTTSTIYERELIGRLIKVDLECTPPLLSVPPQQRCVFLWLDTVNSFWRHKYGGDQCRGATTTIVPPRPSNNADSRASVFSITVMMMMMMILLQLMWHIIL